MMRYKNRRRRLALTCWLGWLAWALGACAWGQPAPAGPVTLPPGPTLLARYTGPTATSIAAGGGAGLAVTAPPPTAAAMASATPTPGLLATPTLAPTEAATPLPFAVCSPLQYVDLKNLPRVLSNPYHPPPMGSDAEHQGVDFAYYHWKDASGNDAGAIAGSAVQAILPGRVATALDGTFPFGTLVIVETPAGWLPEALKKALGIPDGKSLYHLYAHMQDASLKVAVNDWVAACRPLGQVGDTGNTRSNHLHLETRYGPPGVTFLKFAAFTTVTPGERANYVRWRISGDFLHFDPMRLFQYAVGSGG